MDELYYRLILSGFVLTTMTVRFIYDVSEATKPIQNLSEQKSHLIPRLMVNAALVLILAQLFGLDPFPMNLEAVPNGIVRSFGLVCAAPASVLMTWPRVMRARQRAWSAPVTSPHKVPGHQLVTWGPYSYIRHPFYVGMVLGVAAVQLTIATYCVFFIPIIIAYGLNGVKKEEQQLEAIYGDEYRHYKSRTWRFVPFLH